MPELLRTMPEPDRLDVLPRQCALSGRPPRTALLGMMARRGSGHAAASAVQMTTTMSREAHRHRHVGLDGVRSPSGPAIVAPPARCC